MDGVCVGDRMALSEKHNKEVETAFRCVSFASIHKKDGAAKQRHSTEKTSAHEIRDMNLSKGSKHLFSAVFVSWQRSQIDQTTDVVEWIHKFTLARLYIEPPNPFSTKQHRG